MIIKMLYVGAITITAGALAGQSGARESGTFQREFSTPRHIESICPPDYSTAREDFEFYIKGIGHWAIAGPIVRDLIEDFGTQPITVADIEVLSDAEDAHVCKRLNERFNEQIDLQIRLWENAEPEYVFDISYYKTPDFYFVVLGGGFLIQEDPRNPEKERAGGVDTMGGSVAVFDKNLNPVFDRKIREMIERGEIQPATDW